MKFLNLFIAALWASSSPAHAQVTSMPAPTSSSSPQSSTMAEGEVRKVDRDAGKITLRHGPLVSLDMPAMTMVFRVNDPKMLDSLKDGDRVRFLAERVNGAFTVTRIEPAN